MTHFSDKPSEVRVDFFRQSGKWYDTTVISMIGTWGGKDNQIRDAVRRALTDKGLAGREFIAVVLDPYHEHSHPVMLMPGSY